MDAKLIRAASKGAVALIVPNLNVDLRALPASVTEEVVDATKAVVLDKDRAVRRPTDPQLYQLSIEISAAERTAHPALHVEITGLAPFFTLLNTSGLSVASTTLDVAAEFKKSTKVAAGALTYFIEAEAFAVSPLVPASLPSLKVSFTENSQPLGSVVVPLFLSDLILLGDNEPASRLYIADTDDNQPTLAEVKEGARTAGVPVVTVPATVCNGDTWLQDQFQLALAVDNAAKIQTVVVHLPRMRSNSQVVKSSDNLAAFVDNHFPSKDIGVFRDFWETLITVPAASAQGGVTAVRLKLKDSNGVLNAMMPVSRTWAQIVRAIGELTGTSAASPLPIPFFTKRSQLDKKLAELKATPANAGQKPAKDALTAALDQRLKDIDTALPLLPGAVRLTINQQSVEVSETALNDLYVRLTDLHSSSNYGGNVEVTPPTADAPLGKIVTGDVTSQDVQTTLKRIVQVGTQPWVQVGTTWLSVGHVDEIASFVTPTTSSVGSLAVLRASPRLAIVLLEAVQKARAGGTLATRLFRGKRWLHEEDRSTPDPLLPPTAYRHLVFNYGKYDLKEFPTHATALPFGPSAYYDDRKYLYYLSGDSAKREYAAHMSVEEVLDICRETNQAIDDVFLAGKGSSAKQSDYPSLKGLTPDDFTAILRSGLDAVMKKELATATLIPVPVMFDRVDSFTESTTGAFTPGVVNLQQLGRTVLVPRPIGPRMRPKDAVTLLGAILADDALTGLPSTLRKGVATLLTPANLHARGLDVTTHWASRNRYFLQWDTAPMNAQGNTSVSDKIDAISDIFRDGFDEFVNPDRDYTKNDTRNAQTARDYYTANIAKVRQRIAKANPGVFDTGGYLNGDKWVKIVIPENTVDVFEVYTHLVLEALGLTVRWVDSWFYHVHAGGVHCATNALRTVSPAELARRTARAADL